MKVKEFINYLEGHNLKANVKLIINNQEISLKKFCVCSKTDCKCQEKEIFININEDSKN